MGVSQFNYYASSTGGAGAPGQMTGQAGELLRILDACLVNGWTGHAAAGWSQVTPNSGNIGTYTQGAGSAGMSIVVNDNGPNVTSSTREAWVTGWETVATIGAPVGTGTGQFPLPAQLLTTGHVVVRKSATTTAVGRSWQVFADSKTFYMFIQTGDDGVNDNWGWMFGDIFSLYPTDAYRAMLIGRIAENIQYSNGAELFGEMIHSATALSGHYMPRTWTGAGASLAVNKTGDMTHATAGGLATFVLIDGILQTPNAPDSSLILSPLMVHEPGTNPVYRGRMRGLYHICHPKASFSDGQTFSGGGDYAGKTFQVIDNLLGYASTNIWATGCVAIETSNTVETN